MIRVCHVVASLNEDTGGPAHSVAALAEGLVKQNVATHLVALDYPELGTQIIPRGANLHSFPATMVAKRFRGLQPQVQRNLTRLAATELDVLHNHGIWMFPNIYARQAAKRNGIPLITSPRGMLEPWALSFSKWKKRISWSLYERANLKAVEIFHATSCDEVESIRHLGFKQPVALIPNGISIPAAENVLCRDTIADQYPAMRNKKWLLCLTRLHPKKGLDNLLHVWAELRPEYADWHLMIAGSDLIGYRTELERLVSELKLQDALTLAGPVSGVVKESALSNAALFALPSHSENFGMVIGESLAHGVPVVTTKGTPWCDLEKHNCGWWIDDNREALKNTLRTAMSLEEKDRKRMGQNGRALIEQKYSWENAAAMMSKTYEWLLHGGTRPAWIDT